MNIKKILVYLIFAFVMIMPFSVSAEDVEYDIKLDSSYLTMVDYDYLNKIKLSGYNAVIKSDSYLNTHNIIETYNEFYLNNGYFIAYGPDGELGIYYDFSGNDYIYGSTVQIYYDIASGTDYDHSVLVGFYYDSWYSFNNVLEPTLKETKGFYSMVDKNVNNTDMIYVYKYPNDFISTNNVLPNLKYTILATNRSFKWISSNDSTYNAEGWACTYSYFIKQFAENYLYRLTTRFVTYDVELKTLNSKPGNVFRHPYSTEETEKVNTNKTSTVISINSSNYTSFRLKYNINSSLKKDWYWWTNPWSYGTDKEKKVADWLNIQINSTNSISYPRRYTGYKKGSEIEITKMPNDFGNTVLSSSYAAAITSLDGRNGAVEGYFDFDLRDLPENTIITIYLEYDPEYVQFESVELPETNYIEYDMTGKYAVGLVPKFTYSNNTFSLLYQGNFTTYYAFNSNTYNVYDSDIIQSLDNYSKKLISFSNFKDTTVYEKPIFYIMNNLYTDDTQVSKIKYNPDYFELLVYNTIEDVVISEYTGHSYSSPSQNYNSSGSGINDSNNSSESNSILDFSNLFTNLPGFIVGLGSAFTALGTCIMIAFSSLPEMVQSVLWFCLLVSAIVLVIKLLK